MSEVISHRGRFTPERGQSSHATVVRVLGGEIVSGKLKPGANLPAEPELLARFGVSRTCLREALKTLAAKGLVTSKTRVGTRVLPESDWNYFDAALLTWKAGDGFDAHFRMSLTEIRQAVEGKAAELCALRRTPEQLEMLRRCIADMRAPGHTAQSFAEADLAFHIAIGVTSGNPFIRSVAAVIEAALVASFAIGDPAADPRLHEAAVREHEVIVDAIEAGDPDAARRGMLGAIHGGLTRMETNLARRAGDGRAAIG
jgi:DNA-binding FadR family transcriptional regulator